MVERCKTRLPRSGFVHLAKIINIQIVVILPSYPKKVGLAKPKRGAACWAVGIDKGKNR